MGFDDPEVNAPARRGAGEPPTPAPARRSTRTSTGGWPSRTTCCGPRGRSGPSPCSPSSTAWWAPSRPTTSKSPYTGLALGPRHGVHVEGAVAVVLARELGKRALLLVLVLFLVTLFTSALLSLVPGDPVDTLVPLADSPETEEIKAEVRENLGLDDPFLVRYWRLGARLRHRRLRRLLPGVGRPTPSATPSATPCRSRCSWWSTRRCWRWSSPSRSAWRRPTGPARGSTRAPTPAMFALLAVPNFVLGLALAYYFGVWLNGCPRRATCRSATTPSSTSAG